MKTPPWWPRSPIIYLLAGAYRPAPGQYLVTCLSQNWVDVIFCVSVGRRTVASFAWDVVCDTNPVITWYVHVFASWRRALSTRQWCIAYYTPDTPRTIDSSSLGARRRLICTENLVKFGGVVLEICSRTEKQTHTPTRRQAYHNGVIISVKHLNALMFSLNALIFDKKKNYESADEPRDARRQSKSRQLQQLSL